MAKTKMAMGGAFVKKAKVRRPGIHSKTRASKLKHSKLYHKRYRGQG